MNLRLRRLREALRTSLWAVPTLATAVAALLAVALLAIDRRVADLDGTQFGFSGGPGAASDLLGTIATSVLSVAGVVFSITMLVLQQASRQLSPRVMRTFLRDWPSQLTLGAFISTFAYAMIVLSQVRTVDELAFAPGLATWGALALTAVSVGMFVMFIHHVATSLQPTTVIGRVGRETAAALDPPYPGGIGDDADPDAAPPDGPPDRTLDWDGRAGTLTAIDGQGLLEWAASHDAVVVLRLQVGHYVTTGTPLLDVWCDDHDAIEAIDLDALVGTGRERTMVDDPVFGFRQLVDIAVRALSPGVNDPTTAVQVLDELHDRLRQLATVEIPSACRTDDGVLRLVLPRPEWDDYLALAVDEIRHHAERASHVLHRLGAMLADLDTVVPEHRGELLAEERRLVVSTVDRVFADRHDRQLVLRPIAGFVAEGDG
ncbi:MAG TPA: DUF2254 domain-containing protein [Acidimicrobiales bacterium]|nr:DUF2254 domain-containing protein [Acidimicrobiales bacterium]